MRSFVSLVIVGKSLSRIFFLLDLVLVGLELTTSLSHIGRVLYVPSPAPGKT